jgi:four helix bundle protein
MSLAKDIYLITETFPDAERFGLSSQMRRAAVSIPSNIAEGAGRRGTKEFRQFLGIAQGSASELDTHIELSRMIGLLGEDDHRRLAEELDVIGKMVSGLLRALKI